MLENTITLSYVDEGASVASDHAFSRNGFPTTPKGQSYGDYASDAWKEDPALTEEWFTLVPTAPKESSNFYGTRRGHMAIYRKVSVAAPLGTNTTAVANIHLNSSIPVGMTGDQIEEFVRMALSLFSSDSALNHIKSSEI